MRHLRGEERRRLSENRQRGFVLFDVLMALFLFGLGFAALYGLKEAAYAETRAAISLTEAANVAQAQLETLLSHSWTENISSGQVIPGGLVARKDGPFQVQTTAAWGEVPWLLNVKVLVDWPEGQTRRSYELEGLYDVESSE